MVSDEEARAANEQGMAAPAGGQTPGVVPAPIPIPVGEPPRKRTVRWWRVVAAVLTLAVVAGCAVGIRAAVRLLGDVFGATEDAPLEPDDWGVAGSGWLKVAQWSGDGRYLVVQHLTDGGRPAIIAIEKQTRAGRVIEGYRPLFVEPEAPVVWLERIPASDLPPDDGLGDTFDHVPDELLVWRLDGKSSPRRPASLRWEPIPGPGGMAAFLAVDPALGVGPAKIAFGPSGGEPPAEPAYLRPVPKGTLVPIGWSPSGRYFAVEGLLGSDPLAVSELPAVERPERHLYVIDAAKGAVVSRQRVQTLGMAPSAVWMPDEDTLVWLEPDEMRPGADSVTAFLDVVALSVAEGREPRLSHLSEQVEAHDVVDETTPFPWLPCGVTEKGPIFFAGSSVHRVDEDGVFEIASLNLPDGVPAWHPEAGLGWATAKYDDDGTLRVIAYRANEFGADSRVLWTGAEERPSPFGW